METVTVNIQKLRRLFNAGGVHIQAFFIRPESGSVRFIQCVTRSAITVLVYIPRDYTVKSDDPRITWEIERVDLTAPPPIPEEIIEEYAENVETSLDTSEACLRQGYQIPVDLSQQPTKDLVELRDIMNQLDRLKHSVAGIPYSLAVTYGSFIIQLDTDGEQYGYRVIDFPHQTNSRRLYILADLETVYSKMSLITTDVDKIYRSITGILTRNQKRLARGLASVIETRGSALELTQSVNNRVKMLKDDIVKYGDLFSRIGETISHLETAINNADETTVYEDMAGSSNRYKLSKDLERAKELRRRVADKLTALRENYEYMVLNTDQILFENILALERVSENLTRLARIAEV